MEDWFCPICGAMQGSGGHPVSECASVLKRRWAAHLEKGRRIQADAHKLLRAAKPEDTEAFAAVDLIFDRGTF